MAVRPPRPLKKSPAPVAFARRPTPPRDKRFVQLCLATLVALGGAWHQAASSADLPALTVKLDAAAPCELGVSQVQDLPQEEVALQVRNGPAQRWRGVRVTALLKACGLDLAANLGGGFVARRVLVARASDGYAAAFGLAEIDPRFGRQPPLVAWTDAAGHALSAAQGPWLLIAPEDARASRAVRQLHTLEVLVLP